MYEVFDSYLNVDTWHTNHDLDERRFFQALGKVVRDDAFNPDEMGSYMLSAKGLGRDNEDDAYFVNVIDRRVLQAWAIRDFLQLGL